MCGGDMLALGAVQPRVACADVSWNAPACLAPDPGIGHGPGLLSSGNTGNIFGFMSYASSPPLPSLSADLVQPQGVRRAMALLWLATLARYSGSLLWLAIGAVCLLHTHRAIPVVISHPVQSPFLLPTSASYGLPSRPCRTVPQSEH